MWRANINTERWLRIEDQSHRAQENILKGISCYVLKETFDSLIQPPLIKTKKKNRSL